MEIEFVEANRDSVDNIPNVHSVTCKSVGGVGNRYTCLFQGQETCLWMEKGPWFVCVKKQF